MPSVRLEWRLPHCHIGRGGNTGAAFRPIDVFFCRYYHRVTCLIAPAIVPSTTLKLSDPLKARIASLADSAGKSSHAFMVEALEAQVRVAEQRREFVQSALRAEQEVEKYGLVYSADEVHRYLRGRLAGKKNKRPTPIKR